MPTIRLGFDQLSDDPQRGRVLWMDDGIAGPNIFVLPEPVAAELDRLSRNETVISLPDRQLSYGLSLRGVLSASKDMARVGAYLESRLSGASSALKLLVDSRVSASESSASFFDGVVWELIAGMQGRHAFDALEPDGCVARVVRRGTREVGAGQVERGKRLAVAIWCPDTQDPFVRNLSSDLHDRLQALRVRPLGPPTSSMADIAELIGASTDPVILHIVAHGGASPDGKTLVLTDQGELDALRLETTLMRLHRDLRRGRIAGVVLDICGSADDAVGGHTWGIGPRLVQFGFPFAIAAAGPLQISHAVLWSHTFYATLAEGQTVFEATTEARIRAHHSRESSWYGKRLFVASTWLAAGAGALIKPTPDRASHPPDSHRVMPLRSRMERSQRDQLGWLETRVQFALRDYVLHGVRFDEQHVLAVEGFVTAQVASFERGTAELTSDEVFVLLAGLRLYPLGWRLLPEGERERARWGQAVAALHGLSQRSPTADGGYEQVVWEMLSDLSAMVGEGWADILRMLERVEGALPLKAPWRSERRAPGVRHELLAALIRMGIALDAGRHRLQHVGKPVTAVPSLEAWLHACSLKGTIRDNVVRFGFQVPDRRVGRIVQHAVACDAWQDSSFVLDTLAQAGARLVVLAPEIDERIGESMLRYEDGRIAGCRGLKQLLVSRLRPGNALASSDVSDQPKQDRYAMASLTGVTSRLELALPADHTGTLSIAVEDLDGTVIAGPVRLGPGAGAFIDPEKLGLPPSEVCVWRITAHRRFVPDIEYRGYFFWLSEARRARLQAHLAVANALPEGSERELAVASVYRSHGCWSDALHVLNTEANRPGAERDALRYSLFAAMVGIYERMALALRELPSTDVLIQRLSEHVHAIWLVRYGELGVLQAPSFAHGADGAAGRMLAEAEL